MKLNYVIEFVADMDRAVTFYRDVLGLPLKFQSPGWASSRPAKRLRFASRVERIRQEASNSDFSVAKLGKFHQEMSARGVQFSMPPTKQDFGGTLAQFLDSEGGRCSVAEETPSTANQY